MIQSFQKTRIRIYPLPLYTLPKLFKKITIKTSLKYHLAIDKNFTKQERYPHLRTREKSISHVQISPRLFNRLPLRNFSRGKKQFLLSWCDRKIDFRPR